MGWNAYDFHDAVGIEPHGQVLAELDAGLPVAEEPAPGLIAAVANLVGLAEDALEGGLVRLPHHDELAMGDGISRPNLTDGRTRHRGRGEAA